MNSLYLKGLLILSLLLGVASGVAADEPYVSQSGDTLSSIAERAYGDRTRWRYLYEANREKVEGKDSLLPLGTALVVPKLDLETAPTYRTAYDRIDDTTGAVEVALVAISEISPFSGKSKRNGGMLTELVAKAFRILGYQPVVEFAGSEQESKLDDLGEVTAVFPYLGDREPDQQFLLSSPVFESVLRAYSRNSLNFEYSGKDDLLGRRLCVADEYVADAINKIVNSQSISIIRQTRLGDCFVGLVQKDVDLVIADERDGEMSTGELGFQDQVRRSTVPIQSVGIHVAFSKYSPSGRVLRYKFNKIVDAMERLGEMDRIVSRHMQPGAESVSTAASMTGSAAGGEEDLRQAFETFLVEEAPDLSRVFGSEEDRDALFRLFQSMQER